MASFPVPPPSGPRTAPDRGALARLADDAGAMHVVRALRAAGHEVWMVGGAVRDALLGRPSGDVDLATSAEPRDVLALFPVAVPTGLAHGTVTVVHREAHYEVTTFRTDGTYGDGRHPDAVTFTRSIEEDLARRDFTVNALAWDPVAGRLLDPFGGVEDLAHQVLRAVGPAGARFGEDALRMMRACRFAAQLGFRPDDEAVAAIRAGAASIRQISQERIRDELLKIVMSPKPGVGFETARATGLLPHVLPELAACHGVTQNSFHRWDVYGHTLHVLDAFEGLGCRHPETRLAGLFHDIAKPLVKKTVDAKNEPVFYNHEVVGARVAQQVMRRLKFSNEQIALVSHLVRYHMFHYTLDWTDGAVRRFIRAVGEENLDFLFKLREADRRGNGKREITCEEIEAFKVEIKRILAEDHAFQIKDLDIDGTFLMQQLGLSPSPVIGKILHHLLELCLDDPALNRRDLLMEKAVAYIAAQAGEGG